MLIAVAKQYQKGIGSCSIVFQISGYLLLNLNLICLVILERDYIQEQEMILCLVLYCFDGVGSSLSMCCQFQSM